mmetsp:Transcript_31620/g.73613  ORF Transcript_31620/g.73613 Transcript_31620/m.73613 type:complete len:88 (-) Transcript_31620:573-836(-)
MESKALAASSSSTCGCFGLRMRWHGTPSMAALELGASPLCVAWAMGRFRCEGPLPPAESQGEGGEGEAGQGEAGTGEFGEGEVGTGR